MHSQIEADRVFDDAVRVESCRDRRFEMLLTGGDAQATLDEVEASQCLRFSRAQARRELWRYCCNCYSANA